MEQNNDLTRSVLKLMRAMRRRPMRPEHSVPPAFGRMLMTLKKNNGASPAELCEYMDVRPSSMSELLSRMEEAGYVSRVGNEEDRRATRVYLSDAGTAEADKLADSFETENAKFAACFTDEEKVQFCTLCGKLSAHLENLAGNEGWCEPHGPCGGHGGHHGPHGHRGPHPHHHGDRS